MTAHVDTGEHAAARALRQACSRRRTSRAASPRCGRSSSRCSTCSCIREYVPGRGAAACRRPRRCSMTARREVAVGPAPRLRPVHARVRPRLRGRVRRRLLQLQVGGGARPPMHTACSRKSASCRRPRGLDGSATRCWPGRQPPGLDSFVAFRGRPPQLDALLRHNGMTTSSYRRRWHARGAGMLVDRRRLARCSACSAASRSRRTAQVYRYTDPDGRVVYSDRAPVAGAKDLSPRAGFAATPSRRARCRWRCSRPPTASR